MSDDIIDRLMGTGGAATHSTLDRVDAADEIIGLRGACARLRAENAKLREALKGCVKYFAMNKITGPAALAARAAMGEPE